MNTGSHRLLDTHVDALTVDDLHARIAESVQAGTRRVFASHNLHSLYLLREDSRLRCFYERVDYVRVDGMSIVLLGRMLGVPLRRDHRVTYVDWLPLFMAEAARVGWRVFYLGSRPGVAERAAEVLRARHPGLAIATAHGYFDTAPGSADNERVIAAINDFRPHVLLVGMGMPRQQHWVLENESRLAVNSISTSGAALDYVVGEIPTPPRWAGRVGLEWLFRLAAEPRRLAGRYLVEPWYVMPLLARHLVRRARTAAAGS